MRSFISSLALGAAFTAALSLAIPASAEDTSAFSDRQKDAIGQIVRDYLLNNPEILQEVMGELEKRQAASQRAAQAAALKENHASLYNAPNSIGVGSPQADVTMIEFFDYNCGYCKKALADVRSLLKGDAKLRLVLKDFPVLGPDSVEASRVALAVKNQIQGDKLFDYHVRLMESRGRVNGERALAVAREMGLDIARIQKDMESADVKATLQENVALGDKLGLSGTPAFIIGSEIIPGAVGADPLRQVVASVRQCGRANC
jgi:protein-disulfide isomerase